jgi:cytidylate kinase
MRLASDERGRLSRVVVDGRDVTAELHAPAVDRLVSAVAAHPEVRAALLPVQRDLAREGGIIMAGRDIGSVVLPEADVCAWLEVSLDDRAARRARQRGLDPASPDGLAIRADLARRDAADSSRDAAPLVRPGGAVVIDGDGTFEDTVAALVAAVRTAEAVR